MLKTPSPPRRRGSRTENTFIFQGLLDSRLRGNDASGTNVAFFNILLAAFLEEEL